jgi:hypothetical protein
MSVALQVFLLVVAIVVAVAGIGVALALRMSARQRDKSSARRDPALSTGRLRRSTDNVVPLPTAGSPARAGSTASTMAVPASAQTPQTPEEAHQAKLAALQALLALGDAKAAAGNKGGNRFADTEPADDGYATTQFTDRSDSGKSPLLNLDKLKPKRRGAQR